MPTYALIPRRMAKHADDLGTLDLFPDELAAGFILADHDFDPRRYRFIKNKKHRIVGR